MPVEGAKSQHLSLPHIQKPHLTFLVFFSSLQEMCDTACIGICTLSEVSECFLHHCCRLHISLSVAPSLTRRHTACLASPVERAARWSKTPTSQRSHYQEVLHRTLSPPPRFTQRPPPHSWKSTINHVSSKPDTTPSPARPLGDHYESVQACVPWPPMRRERERESLYFILLWMKMRHSANASLIFFSKKTLGISSGLYLSQTEKKHFVIMVYYILQPQYPLFCELWRQHSPQCCVSDTVALFRSHHISFTAA